MSVMIDKDGEPIFHDKVRNIPRSKSEMAWCIENNYILPDFRDGEITVEKLLDNVDMKLDWYVPSVAAMKFMIFIRQCVGEEPENLNSLPQFFFIDCLFQQDTVKPYFTIRNIDYDFLKGSTVILATREFSKSVLICYLLLYMADEGEVPVFGKVNFGVYVSDKMGATGNVTATMRTLKGLYMSSEYLQSKFEEVKLTDEACSFYRHPKTNVEINAYNKHLRNGGDYKTVPKRSKRHFSVKGIGASGGRGSRSGLDRPDFAIFDDLVRNDADVSSEPLMVNIEKTIEKDIGGSLSGNGNFKVLIGTAYAEHDPVYSRCDGVSWCPVVFPRAERPPHNGMYDNVGKLIEPPVTKEDFVSVWSDRHSYENQVKEYRLVEAEMKKGKMAKYTAYMQEYFCRISASTDRLIPKSCEQWIDPDDILLSNYVYTWILTTDYTTTGDASSDDSGALLWAIDSDDNWYLMDIALRKMHLEEQYSNTFSMLNSTVPYSPYVQLGVEIDGQQSLHVVALKDRQIKNNTFIEFAKQAMPDGSPPSHIGIRSKTEGGSKFWRFKLTRDRWLDKKIFFANNLKNRPDMKTLLKELKMTSTVAIKGTDNGLDCEVAGTKVCLKGGNSVSIEDIKVGDEILTIGYQNIGYSELLTTSKVTSVIITPSKEVNDYTFSNGDVMSCTDNHMILTTEGYVFASELTSEHKVLKKKGWRHTDINGLNQETTINQQQRLKGSTMDVTTIYTSKQVGGQQPVQKRVRKGLDEIVERKVKDNLEQFEQITLVSKTNKREEITYSFEVEGTNNYLSHDGIVMHNCVSQLIMIDYELPPKRENTNLIRIGNDSSLDGVGYNTDMLDRYGRHSEDNSESEYDRY